MASSTATHPRVKSPCKPVVAELTLRINATPYVVIPIAPGPDNTRAFRLVKDGNADTVYDVARTNEGLVICDCPSYVATYEGNGLATCKHGQSLIQVGLLEAPAFVHVPDEFDEPARVAYDDAREAAAAVDVAAPARAPLHPTAYDPRWHAAQDAVARGNAVWLEHRHLHASGPMPAPDHARDIVLVDDDGTPLETPAEMDARHRAEHAAAVAGLMEGNPFLPPCCPDADPMPCSACVTHEGPADLSDDGWDDSHVWSTGDGADEGWDDSHVWTITGPDTDDEPARLSFPDWIESKAQEHARIGGGRHSWLAGKIAELARQARFLDAATPGDFDAQLEACLDAARSR